MKLLALALSLTLNFQNGGVQIKEVSVSPNIAVLYDFKLFDESGTRYHDAFTAPLFTVMGPRVYDNDLQLNHETYHFWNHYGQMGLLFLPAYATDRTVFEDYLGTPFAPKNMKPKYYLFNWEEGKGFSVYKQLYLR